MASVQLCHPPVTWTLPHEENDPIRTFFDDYHSELLFIGPQSLMRSNIDTASLYKFKIVITDRDNLYGVRFSPDRQFIALQTSNKELKVLDNNGLLIATRECPQDRTIVGFYWIQCDFAQIMLITSTGVEFLKIDGNYLKRDRTCGIKYKVRHFWYLPGHQFMLLVNPENVFQAFTVQRDKPTKLAKFEIVSCTASSLDRSKSFYHQIQLFDI
eukprot:184975_1